MTVGVRIDRAEAIYRFDRARFQGRGTQGEHPAVQGLLALDASVGTSSVATLLGGEEIGTRLEELQFKAREVEA